MARECRPFILALAVQTLLSQVRYRNAVQTLLSQVRYRNQTKGQFYHPKTLTGVQSVAMNA
jgi:hypothetical protein